MLTGPQPKGAHRRTKFTLDILRKLAKSRKINYFGRFAYGAHENLATALDFIFFLERLLKNPLKSKFSEFLSHSLILYSISKSAI
jgi:hypothetical protein